MQMERGRNSLLRRLEKPSCRVTRKPCVLNKNRARPYLLQIPQFGSARLTGNEPQRAKAFAAVRNERVAKGSRVDSITNNHPFAMVFASAGGHRLAVKKQIVQPSGAGKSGGLPEEWLGIFYGEELQKLFRADPGPAPEQVLKMKFAQTQMRRRLRQRRLRQAIAVQKAERLLNQAIIKCQL